MFKNKEMIFDQIIDEWMVYNRYTVKNSSFFFYEIIIERHIRPYFGNFNPEQINNILIQKFINEKITNNLSVSYINSIIILLRRILVFAEKHFSLKLNQPFIQFPKNTKNKLKVYSFQEWTSLTEYLKKLNNNFSMGLLLCMYTGIRIGELSGLKWEDFDISLEKFIIQRTVYRAKNPNYSIQHGNSKTILYFGSPKTQSSIRELPIPSFFLNRMQNISRVPNTFILTGTEHCMEPRCIQKKYKKILEKCNLRYLNFHSLRHSFATLGIQKGFDYKTLSEILGHSSVNTTLNIYVHSNLERKKQCIESFFSE